MPTQRPSASWPWFAPPFALGVFLRLAHLQAQLLGGDELNGVERALELTVSQALSRYHLADNCLPLTALYRLLLDLGLPPNELLFRAPSLLAGIGLAIWAPIAIARRVTTNVGLAAAWLFALSPILVLYSRIARPYEILALTTFGAALAFDRWWRTGSRAAAAAFVALAALSLYLHLGAAPFVAAPLLLGAWLAARRVPPGRSLRDLFLLGAATACCCLLFLVPAWSSLRVLVAEKQDPLAVSWSTAAAVLRLQSGTAALPVTVLFWALCAVGFVALWHRHPDLARLTACLAAGQVLGLLMLHPEMLEHPLVFDRYLIPTLPLVLVWAACGLALPRFARTPRHWTAIGAAAVILVLLLASPFSSPAYAHTSFAASNDRIDFFASPAAPGPSGIPEIYRHLHGGPVLEVPWNGFWGYSTPYDAYQQAHGQDVVLGLTARRPPASALRFRNISAATPEAFLCSRARFLVVHEDLPAELAALRAHAWPFLRGFEPDHARQARQQGRRLREEVAAAWGPADFTAPTLAAWDMDRVRRRQPHGPPDDEAVGCKWSVP